MAVPTPVKTWLTSYNNTVSGQADADDRNRQLALDIKAALIGFASNAWTVVSSSDGVTADASDNWSVLADITEANDGSAHSWIVLQQAAINTNFQLCLDFSSSIGPERLTVVWSPNAAFAGGTTTNRPTATGEVVIQSDAAWAGNLTGSDPPNQHIFHIQQSDDGECTRLVGYYANQPIMFWLFDKPQNPVTGWTDPAVCLFAKATSSTADQMERTDFYDSANNAYGYHNGLADDFNFYCTEESRNNQSVGEDNTPNAFSLEHPLSPMGVLSETVSMEGRHGSLFDLWWGTPSNKGNEYPVTGTRLFAQHGHIVTTWDGTAVTRT